MGLKIVYLDIAVHDLRLIYNYIKRDSKKYADLEIKKIKAFTDSLSNFPLKGKYFETKMGIDILSIVFRNYIVFYSVSEFQINILSIHHHSRLLINNPAFKNDE